MKPSGPTSKAPRRWSLELAGKPDLERCLERIDAWFEQQIIDRPPIRFYKHNAQYEAGEPLDRSRWATMEERWFDVQCQLDAFERSIQGQTFYAETLPVFWPNLGPNAYSAFYAGRLDFAEVTSWYEPVIADLGDLAVLRADPLASPYFRKLEELTRAALERCTGRYLVGYTDYHPSLDCVAAWRGPQALCLDLATAPEKLAPLAELSVRDFPRIYDHFDALLKAHRQPSVTWLGIPSFGKLHIPSCDFASMISTKHFVEFSLPCLQREISSMTHNLYHVDGRGVAQHLGVILALPEIHAIQWVQGLGQDLPILQWVPLLQRIQAAGKSVILDLQAEELESFIGQMKPEGLFLCIGVEPGQELDVIKRVARW
jgi:hypothetical protein